MNCMQIINPKKMFIVGSSHPTGCQIICHCSLYHNIPGTPGEFRAEMAVVPTCETTPNS